MEIIRSQEIFQKLDYIPLFNNLFLASVFEKHIQTERKPSIHFKTKKSEPLLDMFRQHGREMKESLKMLKSRGSCSESVERAKETMNEIMERVALSHSKDLEEQTHKSYSQDEDDSEMDFGNMDFGLTGFDQKENEKKKVKRVRHEKLALRFMRRHQGINYIEVEKYLEAVVSFLAEVAFEDHQKLVEISDFSIPDLKEKSQHQLLNLSETKLYESNLDHDIDKSFQPHKEFTKSFNNKNEESLSKKDQITDKPRAKDFLINNEKVISKVEFQIKDTLNDLMENASLSNILTDLSEIQDKFVVQEKSKLNFLNMLIYSLDFSEMMSLLYGYTIRLLKEEIEEELIREQDDESAVRSEEKSKNDNLVFLIVKLQFRLLLGLAEIKLFEIFYRELNLDFQILKEENMEILRKEIKIQISSYFKKPIDDQFNSLILSKRVSIIKSINKENAQKGRLAETQKDYTLNRFQKLEELGEVSVESQNSLMNPEKENSSDESENSERFNEDQIGLDRNFHADNSHSHDSGNKQINNINPEIDPQFIKTKSMVDDVLLPENQKKPKEFIGIHNKITNNILETYSDYEQNESKDYDKTKISDEISSIQKLNGGFRIINTQSIPELLNPSNSPIQTIQGNFSFRNQSEKHFIDIRNGQSSNTIDKQEVNSNKNNASFFQKNSKIEDENDSLKKHKDNLEELISIQKMVNENGTISSISKPLKNPIWDFMNISLNLDNKFAKSQLPKIRENIKIEHVKSKTNPNIEQLMNIGAFSSELFSNRDMRIQDSKKRDILKKEELSSDSIQKEENVNISIREESKVNQSERSGFSKNNFNKKNKINLLVSSLIAKKLINISDDIGINKSSSFESYKKGSKSKESNMSNIEESCNSSKSQDMIKSKSNHILEEPLEQKEIDLQSNEEENEEIDEEKNNQTFEEPFARVTSRREINKNGDNFNENRPTNKYLSSHSRERNKISPEPILEQSIEPRRTLTLQESNIDFQIEDSSKYSQSNNGQDNNFEIKFTSLTHQIQNTFKSNLVKFNNIKIHLPSLGNILKKINIDDPHFEVKVRNKEEKQQIEKKFRKFRGRIDFLICKVMKVRSEFLSFFDKQFYALIKSFCDLNYMRIQIDLLMKNQKFKLLKEENNVWTVKFKRPVYLNRFKLSEYRVFKYDKVLILIALYCLYKAYSEII